MKTPLKFYRCQFIIRNAVTHDILEQYEFGMLGQAGLPPTIQQQRRYVDHNQSLLEQSENTEAEKWEMWSEILTEAEKTAQDFGEPTGVVSQAGLPGEITVCGRKDLGERYGKGRRYGETATIGCVLIDITELDAYLEHH